jgi:hypothetical protein
MRDLLSPRLDVRVFGRPLPAFHACGYAGLGAGLALGIALCASHNYSVGVFLVTVACAAATFLGLALGVKLLSGAERLVYYHHEIAVLAVNALVLHALGAPVLLHLDLVALFVGTFLACGRVGCFMVGCCHGRPWRRGVAYGDDHVAAGLPARLAGVRLFPVQLAEAGAVAAIAAAGAALIDPAAPGRALVWYVTAYGCVRFVLEPVRGDADVRPHLLGVSEAQWISVVSAAVAALLGRAGLLPESAAASVAAVVLAGAAAARAALFAARRVTVRRPHWTVAR